MEGKSSRDSASEEEKQSFKNSIKAVQDLFIAKKKIDLSVVVNIYINVSKNFSTP